MTYAVSTDLYDGEEPKIDLPPDLAQAIAERAEELREAPLNGWACGNGHRVASRNVHVGLTPPHIACPECGDVAKTAGFPRTTQQERELIEQRNREIDASREKAVLRGHAIDLSVSKVDVGPQPPWLTELPVRIEWYRPSADEFYYLDPESQEFVLRGGLVMRRVDA